jgi:cell volume regulation protein A
VHRLVVRPGSPADGTTLEDFDALPDGAWVSFIVRHGHLVPAAGETRLEAGDDALVLAEPELLDDLKRAFGGGAD